MDRNSSFQPAGNHIVFQNIEGEVVTVNLKCGHYYSFLDISATAWEMLVQGRKSADIESLLVKSGASPAEAASSLQDFISLLLKEELLALAPAGNNSDSGTVASENISQRPFKPLCFQKYVDMEDVLMLDPLHDVDETGWPSHNKH